jgi:hypothetical protein
MALGSLKGANLQVKNESRFPIEKKTSFYSEFDADSEYHMPLNLKLTFDDHSPEKPLDFCSFVL